MSIARKLINEAIDPIQKLQVGAKAYATRLIPGTQIITGTEVTVQELSNQGTKAAPKMRYKVTSKGGTGWVYADDLSLSPVEM